MSAPVLEPRSADELAKALHARIPAFVPGWKAAEGGQGAALLAIYGHFLCSLAERINAAPAKNELAFLDLLGIDVLPAGAARAPVVFSTFLGGGDGRAPARTRLGAKGSDPTRQLVFETERAVGLAEAQLAEVITLWPGRDAYADHSAEAIGGLPFTLWEGLRPVAHELYLGHDLHFALSGETTVSLDFSLTAGGSEPLELEWSWWDGEAWRAFKELGSANGSIDGTAGLTRSGTIRLVTDCAASEARTVGGWESHWLRARVAKPLPPDAARTFPQVDRIAILASSSRGARNTCADGLLPDAAITEGQQLDFTKPSRPLGQQPGLGSAMYFTCADAFSRPDAVVTVCVGAAATPEGEADSKASRYELDVTTAKRLLAEARAAADAMRKALDDLKNAELTIHDLPADVWDPHQFTQWYLAAHLSLLTARTQLIVALRLLPPPFPSPIAAFVSVLHAITALHKDPNELEPAKQKLLNTLAGPPQAFVTAFDEYIKAASTGELLLPADPEPILKKAQENFAYVKARVTQAREKLVGTPTRVGALELADTVVDRLARLSPMTVAAANNILPPTLSPPVLAWEYWSGTEWRSLPKLAGGPANLLADGTFSFNVPSDWVRSEVEGAEGLWARGRLVSGSYAKLRLVAWTDQESESVNFLPIIEPRPPVLSTFRIGYEWTSKPAPAEHVLALNDFRWEDRTDAAAWRGGSFAPFRPVEDVAPALYLGFDRPLPTDELGILLDLELAGVEEGPALEWERWDRGEWRRLGVEDETDRLAAPGIVSVRWPGGRSSRPALVVGASGREIRLADPREAAAFAGAGLVWLERDGKGELATVASVTDEVVATAAPLSAEYDQATLVRAEMPRFGRPRTWLRARLRSDGEPLHARVRGIHPNAVWAAQVDTVENELLGGGNGEPRQVFFLNRTPVLSDELIEVRELEGERAHVEYPLLLEELRAHGIAEADLTVVSDPDTHHVTQVWVPWRNRPTLTFSGPSDRDYTLERTRGRVLFGDGVRGLVLPAGVDNVRTRRYRSGGGTAGNVPAGAIDQVLSGTLVAGVTNPIRAEGGAEPEREAAVLARGPQTVRHRRQALTLADYEALACEASPGVAVARATSRRGRVTIAIVPHSPDPAPEPSWELRRKVREFLRLRAPASLGGAISVVAPTYHRIGASVVLVPRTPGATGLLVADATKALHEFLHPLTGGPDRTGWPFGRDVRLSDVAALLARLTGVDVIEDLLLVVDGAPQPETVVVPPERLVAPGTIDVQLGVLG
jgi:hypothetical protein